MSLLTVRRVFLLLWFPLPGAHCNWALSQIRSPRDFLQYQWIYIVVFNLFWDEHLIWVVFDLRRTGNLVNILLCEFILWKSTSKFAPTLISFACQGSVCLHYKPLKVMFTGDHLAREEGSDLSISLIYNQQSGSIKAAKQTIIGVLQYRSITLIP